MYSINNQYIITDCMPIPYESPSKAIQQPNNSKANQWQFPKSKKCFIQLNWKLPLFLFIIWLLALEDNVIMFVSLTIIIIDKLNIIVLLIVFFSNSIILPI